MDGGVITARRAKHELPNYGVFDDKRVFDPGPEPGPVVFRGTRIGLMICEDWWFPRVSETLAETGAELLLSINGSPFESHKPERRIQLALLRVVETGLPFVFLAQVGGQDELVFDGASFALNADRSLAALLPSFEPALVVTEWQHRDGKLACAPLDLPAEADPLQDVYRALMLGLRDYVEKNRFPGVILGLSGGIDSALSAAIAADALGAERVRAVMLPSPYTSRDSLEDAASCARLLGIRYDTVPITPRHAGVRYGAGTAVRRHPARHHRREHPGPHARPDADGAIEQIRPDGADHRQQERNVGRLRDAVRRHVRRLLGAEGRLQDPGLRPQAAGAMPTAPPTRSAPPAQ